VGNTSQAAAGMPAAILAMNEFFGPVLSASRPETAMPGVAAGMNAAASNATPNALTICRMRVIAKPPQGSPRAQALAHQNQQCERE